VSVAATTARPGPAATATTPASRHWTVEGPADGEPIVFLHGAIVGRIWGPQVRALRDRYRCITVDLPGHGRLAAVPFTFEAAADAVREAIDEAAGGRAIVVGLSLGGYTGMATAARYPDRVRGLVVADASLEPGGVAAIGIALYALLLRWLPATLIRAVNLGLFRRVYGRAVAAELAEGFDPRAGGRGVLALVRERFRDRVRAYGGPVLVLNGDRDVIFVAGERRFVAGLGNVRVERIAGAGHLSNLDRPDAFTAAVTRFAASLR
jgi:pimeloyl-ACP methyl ester carboxylesterase